MVNDDANCTFTIEESHNDTDLFWDIEFSVFKERQFGIYQGRSQNEKNNEYFSLCKFHIEFVIHHGLVLTI